MRAPSTIVVGAGSGIGAAVADRARASGATVVTWDLTGDVDELVDITSPEAVTVAAERTLARLGPPTQLTVTAGVGHGGLLRDVDASDFDRVLATNAKGPWLVMRAFAAPMADPTAPGSIVAVGSISATLADRTMGLYCASKAALEMLVRVAALEWAPGVRVNAVAPGVTDTPMLGLAPREQGWLRDVADRTALGRLGSPEDVADAIESVHGLGWVTGQVLTCDGGLSQRSPIDPLGAHHPSLGGGR